MIEIQLTPELAAKLGLATDGEEITSEKFLTALSAALKNAGDGDESAQQIVVLQDRNTELERLLTEATGKLREIEQAKSLSEVEALLADYDLPEESAAALKELANVNRDQFRHLLGGLRKKAAPDKPVEEPKVEEPPGPVHDPKGEDDDAATDDARNAAISEYRAEHPEASFQQAWQYLRRTKPELFQGDAQA